MKGLGLYTASWAFSKGTLHRPFTACEAEFVEAKRSSVEQLKACVKGQQQAGPHTMGLHCNHTNTLIA